MLRVTLLWTGLAVAFLAVFGLATWLGPPALDDPSPWLGGGPGGALVGVLLLVADVVLPVPASLVMVGLGAAYGTALGALFSLLGGTAAALAGYGIGRRGSALAERLVGPDEAALARRRLDRWGLLLVAATRPVPVLAETVAILAGAGRMGPVSFAAASVAGTLPAAVTYAWAGANARAAGSMLITGGVLGVAALMWLVGRRVSRNAPARHPLAQPETREDQVR